MSQKELISAVGLGAPMYSRIETGKAEPSLSTLEKIALALDVKLSNFFYTENINSLDTSLIEKEKIERCSLKRASRCKINKADSHLSWLCLFCEYERDAHSKGEVLLY